MMSMSKTMTALAAAAIGVAGLSAAPAQADHNDAANFIAGAAAGALIIGALNNGNNHYSYQRPRQSYYYPAPRSTYYYAAPRNYGRPRVVYVEPGYYRDGNRHHGHYYNDQRDYNYER